MSKRDRTTYHKEKRAKEASENRKKYNLLRKEYLTKNPVCECCCVAKATQIHHKARQKGLNRFRFFMAICQTCHNWIHDNSKRARELGYIFDYDPNEENIFGDVEPLK